ncbi:MAG: hypothetical protein JST00_40630 [Deltaproteobacteria bacterium]|nr:hypothetical protein [Deltaproteobacteria bacterium]
MSPRLPLSLAIAATIVTLGAAASADEPESDAAQAPLPPPTPAEPTQASAGAEIPDRDAPAGEPAARHRAFVMSGIVGLGTGNMNTGLGLRVGYLSKKRVYIGGLFQYHFGESSDQGFAGFTSTSSVTYFFHQFEMGYAAKAGPMEIRPYIAMGPAFGFTSRESYLSSNDRTRVTLSISPGLTMSVDLGSAFFVGLDGKPVIFPQAGIVHGMFGAVVGARL